LANLKKLNIFLILLFSSIFLLVVLLVVGFLLTPTASTPNQSGWVDNMWSCMGDWMSGDYPNSDPFLNAWGILLIVAVIIAFLGIGGVAYFFLFPEIRTTAPATKTITNQMPQNSSAYESVLKTLNEDERKVLNVLKKHDGKYLQKYIRHEANLSRLKTHRVLARFAERGIVTLRKTGNTNEVTLAEWLK
jgi:hypothetical protein